MKCYAVKKKLYDYTKNEVTEREAKAIKKHIHTCSSCEEEYLRIRGLKSLFNAELKEAPRGLLKSIKKKAGIRRSLLELLLSPRPVIGFALALIVAAGSYLVNYKLTESRDAELYAFLSDSYNISLNLEEDETNYMNMTDIFTP